MFVCFDLVCLLQSFSSETSLLHVNRNTMKFLRNSPYLYFEIDHNVKDLVERYPFCKLILRKLIKSCRWLFVSGEDSYGDLIYFLERGNIFHIELEYYDHNTEEYNNLLENDSENCRNHANDNPVKIRKSHWRPNKTEPEEENILLNDILRKIPSLKLKPYHFHYLGRENFLDNGFIFLEHSTLQYLPQLLLSDLLRY